jgi:hypothetical protein
VTLQKGRTKTGGRQKGTKNRTTLDIRQALIEGPARVGSDGEGTGGLLGYCQKAALELAKKGDRAGYLSTLSKLVPPGTADDTAGAGYIGVVNVISVPRGCQYDSKSGKIIHADGTVTDPPPFEPFSPTPSVDEQPAPSEPAPVVVLERPRGPMLVIDNEDDEPPGAA